MQASLNRGVSDCNDDRPEGLLPHTEMQKFCWVPFREKLTLPILAHIGGGDVDGCRCPDALPPSKSRFGRQDGVHRCAELADDRAI